MQLVCYRLGPSWCRRTRLRSSSVTRTAPLRPLSRGDARTTPSSRRAASSTAATSSRSTASKRRTGAPTTASQTTASESRPGGTWPSRSNSLRTFRAEDRSVLGPGPLKRNTSKLFFLVCRQVAQAPGYSVELVCHVEAYPRPTITWVHQGIQLSSNQVGRSVGRSPFARLRPRPHPRPLFFRTTPSTTAT